MKIRATHEGGPLHVPRPPDRAIARGSFQEICRVVGYPMTDKETQVFSRKAILPVVCLLIPDVIPQLAISKWGNAECAISMLPPELAPVRESIVDPFRGRRLDAVDEVGKRECAGRFEVQMNVIPGSAGTKEPSISPLDDRRRTCKQPRPPFRIQPRPSILGGPDEMHPQGEVGIRHEVTAASGLSSHHGSHREVLPRNHLRAAWCQIRRARPMFDWRILDAR